MTMPCTSCGAHVPTGVRFCPSCHQFLEWEAPADPASTGGQQGTTPVTAAAASPPAAPESGATNTDRPADDSSAELSPASSTGDLEQARPALRGGGDALRVDPGSSVETTVVVGTTGQVVDEINLHLEGPGAAFGDVTPASVHLYPGATTPVVLSFSPPRNSTVLAGSHGWVLRAVSPTHGGATRSIAGVVEVSPFAVGSAELHPMQTTGRNRAFEHSVSLGNEGNVTWGATLRVEETEQLHLAVPTTPVTVAPGTRVDVAVPGHTKRRWLGSAQTMPFQIHVAPTSVAGPAPMELLGSRTQRAILPVWLLPTALVLVGLAIAAFAVFGGKGVAVPAVAGQSTAAATAALEQAGFDVTPVLVPDDRIAQGLAVGTDPPAGTKVDEGSAVTLSLSLGKQEGDIPIPVVIGSPVKQARADLAEAGLKSSVQEEASTAQEAGNVTRTVPDGGTKVSKGFKVVVFVSSGVAKVVMPGVADQTADDAKSALEGLGLRVKVKKEPSATVPEGNAIRTDPAEGKGAGAGELVTLFVSSGPIVLPDLVGTSRDSAVTALEKLGLIAAFEEVTSEDVPAGDVISTDPPVGEALDPGTTITLVVSTGPESPADPVDLLGLAVDDVLVSNYVAAQGGSWDQQDVTLPNGVEVIGDAATGVVSTVAFDSAFTGELPDGLSLGMSPDEVTSAVGTPPVTLADAPADGGGTVLIGTWVVDQAPIGSVTVTFDPAASTATEISLQSDQVPLPTPTP